MLSLNCKENICNEILLNKFSNVNGISYQLDGNFEDFLRLTKSYENMPEDTYFGQVDCGKRYRRYSDFNYNPVLRTITQLEHRPYFQSPELNRYIGGVERHFGDFTTEILLSPILHSLINLDFEIYKSVLPSPMHEMLWQCQIHQIRIEINPNKTLEITPEGIHSDGYPFSAVHFWGKDNVKGAHSQLFTSDNHEIATVTYDNILDTTYFLDREMKHYVTPASTQDPKQSAYRQIIAISFSRPGTEYDIIR